MSPRVLILPRLCLCLSRSGLLQCGGSLFRTGGSQTSNPEQRRQDNVLALLSRSADAGRPQGLVHARPAAGAALSAAGRRGAAGPVHPAALHGERGAADRHGAGSLRQAVLPGAGLLDGAAQHHAGPAQAGEKHAAGDALQ